jgi:hypothetical protein
MQIKSANKLQVYKKAYQLQGKRIKICTVKEKACTL